MGQGSKVIVQFGHRDGEFTICISLVAELCTGLDVICQDVL